MATIPKLALIPSGYKAGKIYSVLPTSGVGDFDFTRNTTATRINSSGLIETVATGVPRLNYPLIDGVVNGCPSHLLEPERTQKIQYSEAFDNAYWTKTGLSVVSGFTSPKGDLSAFKLVEDTSTALRYCHETFSVVSGNNYTYSFFAKYNGRYLQLSSSTAFPSSHINYDLQNGTLSIGSGATVSGTIEELTDGYYRCTYTDTANSTSVNGLIIPLLSNSTTASKNISYTGDGTSGIYLFGAQFEEGSYATSYIPNYGTAAGITRSAETANGAGDASTFNDSEGVLMAEISALNEDTIIEAISISNGTGDNRVVFMKWNVLNQIKARVTSGGSQQFDVNINVPSVTDNNKLALKYKANDFSAWVNGFKLAIDTSGIAPVGLNRLEFNSNGSNSAPFYGNTKQIQYYDSALNDSDLETLTSWTSFTDMAQGQQYSIK